MGQPGLKRRAGGVRWFDAMNIAVTGASGFIGSALCPQLEARGHRVVRMVRRPLRPGEDALRWEPTSRMVDVAGLAGMDAVVHLAGESIAGRWTAEKKRRIRESRVGGTRLLAEAVAASARASGRPSILLSASGIGIYGDRGDEELTEESPAGEGFLAEVSREWEEAALEASGAGVRVVLLRTALVLGKSGGALERLLPIFRAGLGGPLGTGRMWWSWIALEDHVRATIHCLDHPALHGPVNLAAPRPVTNRIFTQELARAVRRPAPFPVPRFAARWLLGEMADALYCSSRVLPCRLEQTGFDFAWPDLPGALNHILAPVRTGPTS